MTNPLTIPNKFYPNETILSAGANANNNYILDSVAPALGTADYFTDATVQLAPADRFKNAPCVLDWPGIVLDGIHDDTIGLQRCFDDVFAAGGGVVVFPAFNSIARITNTLNIHYGIDLVGRGNGDKGFPYISGTSKILYDGIADASKPMIIHGSLAGAFNNAGLGGGVHFIDLDCNIKAGYALKLIDVTMCTSSHFTIYNPLTAGIWVTSTKDVLTFRPVFIEPNIWCREGASANAIAILVDGSNYYGGVYTGGGATLGEIHGGRIQHTDGDGIVVKGGDGWTVTDLHIYTSGSGNAVTCNPTPVQAAVGGWQFYKTTFTGGIYAPQPFSFQSGWKVGFGCFGKETNKSIVSGPGAFLLNGTDTLENAYGYSRFSEGIRTARKNDCMQFMYFDATNLLVFTSNGTWNVGGTNAAAPADPGTRGGAVTIQAGGVANQYRYLSAVKSPATEGNIFGDNLNAILTVDTVLVASAILRWGYFDTMVTAAQQNCAYLESNSANTSIQCVVIKNGVKTVFNTPIGLGSAKISWQIATVFNTDGYTVAFRYRTQASIGWIDLTSFDVSTAPVSTATCALGYYAECLGAVVFARMDILDTKFCFDLEV